MMHHPTHPLGWTPDRIAKAAQLWAEGHSCAVIAKRVGDASRTAVAGLAYRHRDKFPRRPTGKRVNHNPDVSALKSARLRTTTIPPKPLPISKASLETATGARPWITRNFGECAFPVSGEGAETMSCCNPTDANYCTDHARLMFAKPATEAQRAAAAKARAGKLYAMKPGQRAVAA